MVNSLETAAIASGRVDCFTARKVVLRAADNADDGVFLPRAGEKRLFRHAEDSAF